MSTKKNTDYLKFEAISMLEFLKSKITENGKYTDQIYSGSNLSILLETLSAMFEVLTYNLNFQASEATFNGAQIYDNMLKIVNMLGYKARASIPSTIHGNLTADIYLDKLIPQLTPVTKDLNELVSNIQTALITATNPKTISRNLCFRSPTGTEPFTILENVQVYPEFINLTRDNIFYWTTRSYTNESEQILNYLKHIWNVSEITLDTTIDQLVEITGSPDKTTLIQKYSTIPKNLKTVPCNLRVSSNDYDNFVVAINGSWNSFFVTNSTSGERNETFNILELSVDSLNISDGTLFAAVYNPLTIDETGIDIYKATSSLSKHLGNEKVFEYYVDVNKCITIKFGDGVNGINLPQNSSIMLFFIVNNGEAGEVSQSAFTNNNAQLTVSNVLSRNQDSSVKQDALINRFIYDNINVDAINKKDCNMIAKLVSSANAANEYTPKMDVYFNPTTSSSKFQPIETVEEIRELAPNYNRTNNRIITKNDLDIILKRDYVQYVHDSVIMDNFDYTAKFYNWLYYHDALSKDIAANGYKFSSACNFNDIYIWLKGYTNYPVNDFIKKTMQRSLNVNKVLTSQLVFLDSINTYFYPYIGDIAEDIDWLITSMKKYQFLIKESNLSDPYYKKWKTIYDLFDKVGSSISRHPTKRLINYILSGESTELKVEVNVYRDANVNENLSTIKTNISNAVNNTFSINNNKLGQAVKLNNLNEDIKSIAGVQKIRTTKSKNVNIYTETAPIISDLVYTVVNTEVSPETDGNDNNIINKNTVAIVDVVFDNELSYPTQYPGGTNNIENSFIDFNLDQSGISQFKFENEYIDNTETGETYDGIGPIFYKMDLQTGIEEKLDNTQITLENVEADDFTTTYRININSIFGQTTNTEKSYAIYAKYERTNSELEDDTLLECYTNKIKFTITGLGTVTSIDNSGHTSSTIKPTRFTVSSYIDGWNEASLDLSTINAKSTSILDEPSWEVVDSAYSLSFAKFTNDLIDARDFDSVGAGLVQVEDFCFPTLFQDITSLINVTDEQNTTYNINF